MIAAIEGTLISKGANAIIVKAGPVSLTVNVPGSTLSRLGPAGSEVTLHTHLHVREDNISLYGFSSRQEMILFEQLITVSGIGPKVALSLLTTLSTEQMVSAIISGNADLLSQVPGIGKKTAGRIVLELKGKLEGDWQLPAGMTGAAHSDVAAALTALGYGAAEAARAAASVPQESGLSLEERVRQALAYFGRR